MNFKHSSKQPFARQQLLKSHWLLLLPAYRVGSAIQLAHMQREGVPFLRLLVSCLVASLATCAAPVGGLALIVSRLFPFAGDSQHAGFAYAVFFLVLWCAEGVLTWRWWWWR